MIKLNSSANLDLTERSLRRMQTLLSDPAVVSDIVNLGATELQRIFQSGTDIGTIENRRYARRKIKKKANRPTIFYGITQPGTMNRSISRVAHSPTSQEVGYATDSKLLRYIIIVARMRKYQTTFYKRAYAPVTSLMRHRIERLIQQAQF
jgi:hypothetical protein